MLSSADLLHRSIGRLKSAAKKGADAKSASLVAKGLAPLEKSAGILIEGARRIQAVVKTLRLFSRLDEAELKPVDLHEGLDTTLELLQYRIGSRIRVVKEYGKLPEVFCRPDALNQVFMNLLLNAVQAIDREGEISVATRVAGKKVIVEIADSGAGIAEEDLPRIFDLGFTTKGGAGGAGIGLALTRRIVEEHDGTIAVRSAPGQGSTFTVRLPLKSPPRGKP
jgi:two-component system NtrC family sensor kinase